MIICHCQNITDHDIHSAIDWMRAADPETLITPGKIYHALGKAADCGGCMPLFLGTMRKNQNLEVPMHLRTLRDGATQETRPCKATRKSSTT
ncbi:(2Fe-2S)-binding protein [Mameliella alba]|jgi:bacterioferritin-associated ferredoxin|uniref:Putative bacterioferritin-associated ferredoxin n=2 Tax=Roseobacteraceae TaxID=2854170 RepID=A0A0B3RVB3_9RHOB|nr:(2Fe-2S)-binding protein [Mameliella alba]KHQ52052.1 putative bacterioferritin-associated ferredoxin [Mameliella alba]MBY6119904.1 (2Fe-2S)-binding protein [Mameliella alba]OWV45988.1 (2Fe-2S)-binding protein [Mameliella alba]OWV49821.1 (2Fe-2S)-binding protein [Mameliella alba]OWV63225.1 (2Fe-2S)-binding protein [Mameliella alba]